MPHPGNSHFSSIFALPKLFFSGQKMKAVKCPCMFSFQIEAIILTTQYLVKHFKKVIVSMANLMCQLTCCWHYWGCGNKKKEQISFYVNIIKPLRQGVKLIFFSESHLAPKFFKVVANSKKLVAIFKDKQNISLCCQGSR